MCTLLYKYTDYAFVKHDNFWYRCDDSHVAKMSDQFRDIVVSGSMVTINKWHDKFFLFVRPGMHICFSIRSENNIDFDVSILYL